MAGKVARSQRTARGGDPREARSLINVGELLAGKYRVERILGEGGMGVVVAAYHELLDQHVAVKLLYQDVADREAQSRLLLEARSAAKLQSEHVARVIDVDTGKDGLPFIVMELLDGADLCQIADARGALPRWLVVDYVLQALEGLAHAHVRGIIHRDLKPSNLFLANKPDGTQILKILDFGISKSQVEGDRRMQQLTGGRAVLGSPPYMSPEQVRSPKTVDHRTDIWSLGICMYELLTNSMPFGGDEIQETFAQVLENEPTPIRELVTGVPDGLEKVVMKCLAKKREHRWNDVGELAKALAPYGSGSWIQSADRVCATLARPVMDDATSGTRLKHGQLGAGLSTPQSVPIAIPSAPGRRLDSLQPELTGTASTVARRFPMFEGRKRPLFIAAFVAALLVPAVVGIGLIGASVNAKAKNAAAASASEPSSAEPAPAAAPVDPPSAAATAVMTPATATAGPENELPSAAAPASTSPLSASTASARPKPVAFSPAPKPAPAPTPKKPASTSTARPALPPGLPLTRQ